MRISFHLLKKVNIKGIFERGIEHDDTYDMEEFMVLIEEEINPSIFIQMAKDRDNDAEKTIKDIIDSLADVAEKTLDLRISNRLGKEYTTRIITTIEKPKNKNPTFDENSQKPEKNSKIQSKKINKLDKLTDQEETLKKDIINEEKIEQELKKEMSIEDIIELKTELNKKLGGLAAKKGFNANKIKEIGTETLGIPIEEIAAENLTIEQMQKLLEAVKNYNNE